MAKLYTTFALACSALTIIGCTRIGSLSDQEKIEAHKCIGKINIALRLTESLGAHTSPSQETNYYEALQESRARHYSYLTQAKKYLEDGIQNHQSDMARAYLESYDVCKQDHISIENPGYMESTKWAEKKRREERAEIDEATRDFDAAQDDILKDYAKKAAKHYITPGPSIRIDTFLMKNGSMVICKTSVVGGGRATSCN